MAHTVTGGIDPVAVRTLPSFDAFFTRHYRSVLGLAWSLTGDRAAAEDLTQDAFVDAHRRWSRLAGYDDPAAWVRRAVANRAVSRWRRLGREARAVARLGGLAVVTLPELDPVDEAFWDAVRALPRRQAQAVALHYLDGLSLGEIAAVLGCSEGSVKTHLHRGRAALAARLGLRAEDEGDDR